MPGKFRTGCFVPPTAILVLRKSGGESTHGNESGFVYDECSFGKVSFLTHLSVK